MADENQIQDGESETQTPAQNGESVTQTPDEETVNGLKTALTREREQHRSVARQLAEERRVLAKQLRDATAKAEQGSAAAQALEEISTQLANTERRAAFFESALTANCVNPKAAYLVASAEGMFRKSGEPDWPALQAVAPELFRKPGQANAGAGTGAPPPARQDMNMFIRKAAGYGG